MAPTVQIQAPTDQRHLVPQDEDQEGWYQDTRVPSLPDVLDGEQGGPGYAGGGPVDLTPWDHGDGGPRGNGLTTEEAQEIRSVYHEIDQGSYAAHTWNVQAARDGEYNVDVVPDMVGDGTSPETLTYQVQGVGAPTDPYARPGRRIQRWRDRFIDRHFWEASSGPTATRNAYTAPAKAAQGNGNQTTSPYEANTIRLTDQFVAPQNRITPRPWDQPITTTGDLGTNEAGLPTWGL
jgi:hypothetical protein